MRSVPHRVMDVDIQSPVVVVVGRVENLRRWRLAEDVDHWEWAFPRPPSWSLVYSPALLSGFQFAMC